MNPDELARQLDEMSRRIRVVETHSLGVPAVPTFAAATVPNPAPVPVVTTVVLDIGFGATLFGVDGGTFGFAAGVYTIAKAGTIILEGACDCRAEYWDNFQTPPRREIWTDSGGPGANAHTELPTNLVRSTVSNRSGPLAVGIGTYTAQWLVTMTGGNQLHVYSGYLRVTWTG